MSRDSLDLIKGTLDLLILKTLSLGPKHGYDISKWVRWKTGGTIRIEDSALYQALRRMENKGLLESEWKQSPTGREAKFYQLTPEGNNQLMKQSHNWQLYSEAMSSVLSTQES